VSVGIYWGDLVCQEAGARFVRSLGLAAKGDLAAIKLDTEEVLPSVKVGKKPWLGERVFTVGHPAAQFYTLSYGYVSNAERGEEFQLDITASYGSSGAGVFNRRGEVVGIIHRFLPDYHPSLVYAMTLEKKEWE